MARRARLARRNSLPLIGVLRVDGSLVLPLLVLVLVLPLLVLDSSSRSFQRPERSTRSTSKSPVCRRRYQPLQALLLRSRTSIASLCPGECSNSSRSLLLRRLLRKGENTVGRRATTPSASAAATTNFSSSQRSKTSREKPDCSHVDLGTLYNKFALGAVERSFDL